MKRREIYSKYFSSLEKTNLLSSNSSFRYRHGVYATQAFGTRAGAVAKWILIYKKKTQKITAKESYNNNNNICLVSERKSQKF